MSALNKSVYLDHAAATPLDPTVSAAMRPWQEENFHNPSSLYGAARTARLALEKARHQTAQVIGAKKSEIIFTAGGTESVNLAILGAARAAKKFFAQEDSSTPTAGKIIATNIEHESVLACLAELEHEGFEAALVPVKPSGIIDPGQLAAAISDRTILVTVAYVNSEIGTIQPLARIGKLIAAIRTDRQKKGLNRPIYLHTDASQAAGWLDLPVSRLGVDLMTLNGSKIYGPKQTGCLYVRTGVKLKPIIFGGGQERGLRSGTENVAGAVGLATALKLVQSRRQEHNRSQAKLLDHLIGALKTSLPNIIINGDLSQRIPGNLNVTIPGLDGESAVLYLDQAGIQAATGSACSTGHTEPSAVLLALGRTPVEANASLRFSFGKSTRPDDLKYLLKILPAIVKQLADHSQ